jgi:hypothetical protein
VGAWGAGPFDNDDASDWLYEVESDADLDGVRAALDVTAIAYLEAPAGSIAIAAAEIIAAAAQQPADSLPDTTAGWIAERSLRPTAGDVSAALAAVERARAHDSELRQLWDEDNGADWLASLDDLTRRLNLGR